MAESEVSILWIFMCVFWYIIVWIVYQRSTPPNFNSEQYRVNSYFYETNFSCLVICICILPRHYTRYIHDKSPTKMGQILV